MANAQPDRCPLEEATLDDTQASTDATADRAIRKGHPKRHYVELDEFCMLATSRRKLFRHDDPGGELRGLFEPATGVLYCIQEAHIRRALRVI